MNTEFCYMYRDGDNWKNSGSVVLAGQITVGQSARLIMALRDEEDFIASQVGVPEVFLWDPEADYQVDDPSTYPASLGPGAYVINDSDHSWHEFTGFQRTAHEPTDPRSIEEFVAAFEKAAREGWKEFEPVSRRPHPVGGAQ